MKDSKRNQVAGKLHEAKGKLTEEVGRATGNHELQAKGIGEKVGGKLQHAVGNVESVLEDAVKDAKAAAKRADDK